MTPYLAAPAPAPSPPPPGPGEADVIIIIGRPDRPSSIIAPNLRTTIPRKRTGDGAAGDLTNESWRPPAAAPARPIEQVEQIRLHRAAQPRARERAAGMVNAVQVGLRQSALESAPPRARARGQRI
jgi:hypothetical protein